MATVPRQGATEPPPPPVPGRQGSTSPGYVAPIIPVDPNRQGATDPPPPEPFDWKAKVRAYYPWLPDALVGIFATAWEDTGDAILALADVRSSKEYDAIFPGIKRADGTLRMSESEWFSTREAYGTLLTEFGLNAQLLEGEGWYERWMEGEKSPIEVAGNLGAIYEQVITNIPQVRAMLSAYEGAELFTDQALFLWALDPQGVGDQILNHKISMAQVGAEGLARGLDVDESFAGRLVAGGVDQSIARGFFADAEGKLFNLDQLAQRHRDPDDSFDLKEFADASIFGDAVQTKRVQRLLRAEASLFSESLGSVNMRDDFALTGLAAR
jgi:hypothetical protein